MFSITWPFVIKRIKPDIDLHLAENDKFSTLSSSDDIVPVPISQLSVSSVDLVHFPNGNITV